MDAGNKGKEIEGQQGGEICGRYVAYSETYSVIQVSEDFTYFQKFVTENDTYWVIGSEYFHC